MKKHPFDVVTIHAKPGGEFVESGRFGAETLTDAQNHANYLQDDFDQDGEPIRTYVYPEGSLIPVFAGRGHSVRRGYSKQLRRVY